MSFPPNAFLIGAMKAGTTSLAESLGAQPHISLSSPKEPHFFTDNRGAGLDWYRARFADLSAPVLLDASTSYSSAPTNIVGGRADGSWVTEGVPERIHALSPHARFIYVIRQPVVRMNSQYWHRVQRGAEPRGLRAAVAADPSYLFRSDYGAQIEAYLPYFDISRFHVLIFEDLIREPRPAIAAACRFLGLEPNAAIGGLAQKNWSYRYNAAGRLLRRLSPSQAAFERLLSLARAACPPRLRERVSRAVVSPIPETSAEDRAYFDPLFRARLAGLERLCRLDLSAWWR